MELIYKVFIWFFVPEKFVYLFNDVTAAECWFIILPFFMILLAVIIFTIDAFLTCSNQFFKDRKEAQNKNKKARASDQNNKTAKSNTIYNIKKTEVNNVTNIDVNNITYIEVKTGQENTKE